VAMGGCHMERDRHQLGSRALPCRTLWVGDVAPSILVLAAVRAMPSSWCWMFSVLYYVSVVSTVPYARHVPSVVLDGVSVTAVHSAQWSNSKAILQRPMHFRRKTMIMHCLHPSLTPN
jgi:hypothetical protein